MNDSCLYQIDNAMGELHYALMKKLDPISWKSPKQFIVYTHATLDDIRTEFERQNGKFTYPSLVVVRNPGWKLQGNDNANRYTLEIEQDGMLARVRSVTLTYNILVLDSRKKYIDEYAEQLLLGLCKYTTEANIKLAFTVEEDNPEFDPEQPESEENPRTIQVKKQISDVAQLTYLTDTLSVDPIPTVSDSTKGKGQIYGLKFQIQVDTMLVSPPSNVKKIHELIANFFDKNHTFDETMTINTIPKS